MLPPDVKILVLIEKITKATLPGSKPNLQPASKLTGALWRRGRPRSLRKACSPCYPTSKSKMRREKVELLILQRWGLAGRLWEADAKKEISSCYVVSSTLRSLIHISLVLTCDRQRRLSPPWMGFLLTLPIASYWNIRFVKGTIIW